MISKDRQLQVWLQKQKQLALKTHDLYERACLLGAWSGFLNSLKFANSITMQEYNRLYEELREFVERLAA